MVAQVEEAVAERARRLVTRMIERHPDRRCDFVAEFPALLQLQIICAMTGIPEEDEDRVFHWTNVILGVGDEEIGNYASFEIVSQESAAYAMAMAEDRRVNPAPTCAPHWSKPRSTATNCRRWRSHRSSSSWRPPATRPPATRSATGSSS